MFAYFFLIRDTVATEAAINTKVVLKSLKNWVTSQMPDFALFIL